MSPDPFSQARAWLGGNLGGSLLERLDAMGPGDWVVLELSSFQLWYVGPETPTPHVAVVTNCTPNHLDWHGRFEDYVAAKQRILTGQTSEDFAVLNTLDPEVRSWGGACGTTAFGGTMRHGRLRPCKSPHSRGRLCHRLRYRRGRPCDTRRGSCRFGRRGKSRSSGCLGDTIA